MSEILSFWLNSQLRVIDPSPVRIVRNNEVILGFILPLIAIVMTIVVSPEGGQLMSSLVESVRDKSGRNVIRLSVPLVG